MSGSRCDPLRHARGRNQGISRAAVSLLVTVVLCVALWFTLNAVRDLIGHGVATIVAVLVFAAAAARLLWRSITGR